MNKERRHRLEIIRADLEAAQQQIDEVLDEERDAFANLPESLQASDRGSAMEAAIDALESASSDLDAVADQLDDAAAE